MSPKRSVEFSQIETESMLDTIRSILPVAGMEWDKVKRLHEGEWPDIMRTKDSLRRKFSALYRTKMPTGDPACPPLVRMAKLIHNEIKEKVDMSDGEDKQSESGDAANDDNNDNDESSIDLEMGGVVVSIAVPPLPPTFSLTKPDFVSTVPDLRAIRDKHIKDQCNLVGLLSPVVSEVANLGLGLASPRAKVKRSNSTRVIQTF